MIVATLATLVVLPVRSAWAVPASQAAQHVGKSVAIEGFVEQIMCSPRACLLSFQAGWSGFVATIPVSALDRFGDVKRLERKNVRLRGVVEDRAGKPRLELTDPSRLQVLEDTAPGAGSRVVRAQEKSRTDSGAASAVDSPPAAQPQTRVQVSGGLSPSAPGGHLSGIVRDLQEEAAVSGTGDGDRASEVAVQGLRERVTMQAHTIQSLEEQLGQLNGRLQELEARPVPADGNGFDDDLPAVDPWIVPARRGFAEAKPRTGWSAKRLVREMGSPLEVHAVSEDTAIWLYEGGFSVTVKRDRVVSTSGF